MDDEQATVGPEDPIDQRELVRLDAAEARPGADDHVRGAVAECPRAVVPDRPDGGEPRTGRCPARGALVAGIDRDDVPRADRAEQIERPIDLAFAIESGPEG